MATAGRLDIEIQARMKDGKMSVDALKKSFDALGYSVDSVQQKVSKVVVGKGANKHLEDQVRYTATYNDGLKKVTQTFNEQGQVIKQTATQTKKAFDTGRLLWYFNILRGVWNRFKNIETSAMDFNETIEKFNVSMGTSAEKAQLFQDKMANAIGTSRAEMMNYQANFKNIMAGLGTMSTKTAEQISESLTKMTLDYSSLFNTSQAGAANKIQAALTGAIMPIRRESGYDVSKNAVSQKVSQLGVEKTYAQLTETEKRLVRIMLLMDQMKNTGAFNDLARTIESPANQIKVLKNQLQELGIWLGNVFMGTIGAIMPYINGFIMALKEIIKLFAIFVGYTPIGTEIAQPLEEAAESVDDINTGFGGASKKAKELKKQLQGFDVLNVIQTPPESGGGGGGGSPTGVDPAILGALKDYDSLMDKVRMKATEIRDKILEWLGFFSEDGGLTWQLREGETNLRKILDVAKALGRVFLGYKLSKPILNLFNTLSGGELGNIQLRAAGIGLTVGGLTLFAGGIHHVIEDGKLTPWSLLEILSGGAFIAAGITLTAGKTIPLKMMLGVGLAIAGVTLLFGGIQKIIDNGFSPEALMEVVFGGAATIAGGAILLKKVFKIDLGAALKFNLGSLWSNSGAKGIFSSLTDEAKIFTAFLKGGFQDGWADAAKAGSGFFGKMKGGLSGLSENLKATTGFSLGQIGILSGEIAILFSFIKIGIENMESSYLQTMNTLDKETSKKGRNMVTDIGNFCYGVAENVSIFFGNTTQKGIKDAREEVSKLHEELKKSFNDVKTGYEETLNVTLPLQQQMNEKLAEQIDENGQIKEGHTQLAQSYIDELNQMDGVNLEIKDNELLYNGEKVTSRDALKTKIDEVIAKLKEEAEQEANIELYKEAVKNRIKVGHDLDEAEKNLQTARDQRNDEDIKKYEALVKNLKTEKQTWASNEQYYNDQVVKDTEIKAGKISDTLISNATTTKDDVEKALKGNEENFHKSFNELEHFNQVKLLQMYNTTDEDIDKMSNEWKAYSKHAPEVFEVAMGKMSTDQKKHLLKMLAETGEMTPAMKAGFINLAEESTDAYDEVMKDLSPDMKESLSDVTKAVDDWKGGNSDALADAAKANAQKYLDEFDDGFKINSPSKVMKQKGEYVIQGLKEGINSSYYQNQTTQALKNYCKRLLNAAKETMQIASPSKATKKFGIFLMQGFEVGMEDEEDTLYKQTQNMAKNIVNALNPDSDTSNLGYLFGQDVAEGINEGIGDKLKTTLSPFTATTNYAIGNLPDVGKMFGGEVAFAGAAGNASTGFGSDFLTQAVSRGVASAMAGMGNQGGSYNLYIDGEQITDVVQKRMNRNANIYGR